MKDIKFTATGDIDLSSGDIQYTESTMQHQHDILIAAKGDYKEYPTIGVDIRNELDNENPAEMLRTIRKEFSSDGMTVKKLDYKNGNLNIDAEYKDS